MSINIETGFSFNGSLIKKDSLKDLTKFGYDSLGIVDDNTAFFLEFYYALKKQNIKPILGLRSYSKYYDYILYPINYEGYKEVLYYASSKNPKDKIERDSLPLSKNILVVIDATRLSPSNIDILKDDYDYFRSNKVDAYVGVDFSYYPCEVELYPLLKDNYKTIIIDKVKYLNKEDKESSEILEAILNNHELKEENIFDIDENINYALLSYKEYVNNYKEYKELIDSTNAFKNKINIEMAFEEALPKYINKENLPSNIYLKALSEAGLKKRLIGTKKDIKKYRERLNYELNIIHEMGFDDYFLVVYDFILYAKKNDIMVGPGRGSAASSLVSYSLGIVDIDPLEYGLLFERFLNPSRKTMPDIDTDFEDTRRDDVIKYVRNKYGETHVSLISTSQTFLAKSAIRDVAKLLNIPQEKINLVQKEISQDNSIDELLENKNIKKYYEIDSDFKRILDISKRIEGLPRSLGTHAAGVIISDKDLRNYTEIHKGASTDLMVSAYDADSLKEIGLLKMDFLALKNLSIIHDILRDIKASTGKAIKLSDISLYDKTTYELLNTKSTIGIFQLESPGMEKLLKDMKVRNVRDLALCIALYRPGPMDQIPLYLKRREGKEKIEYYDESIKDILSETLGIIVYQEQVIQIASTYAGLSMADSDTFRRMISSKDESLVVPLKEKFFLGAKRLGRKESVTEKLFNDMLKFAEYGFNKAHAISYSMISYYLSYLKANYPSYFMANLLKNNDSIKYFKESLSLGIKILPPDARYSSYKYTVIDKVIYMPFTSIKGIGYQLSKEIIDVRNSSDSTFEDFVKQSKGKISRGVIESLIYSGAFDYSMYNKKTMIDSLEGLFEFDASLVKGLENYEITKTNEFDFDYLKKLEFEYLGFNPKYHPIKKYQGKYPKLSDSNEESRDKQSFIAYITNYKEIKTKNKDLMASLEIEDEYKSINAVIFPKDYLKVAHLLKKDAIFALSGYYSVDNRGRLQFVVQNLKEV